MKRCALLKRFMFKYTAISFSVQDTITCRVSSIVAAVASESVGGWSAIHVGTSVTTQLERLSCDDSSAPMTAAEYSRRPSGAAGALTDDGWGGVDATVSIVAGA